MSVQSYALQTMSNDNAVLHAAHLYFVLQPKGLIDEKWPQMEELARLYTKARMLIGDEGQEQSMSGHMVRMMTCMGCPARAMAKVEPGRPRVQTFSTKNRRTLERVSLTRSLFDTLEYGETDLDIEKIAASLRRFGSDGTLDGLIVVGEEPATRKEKKTSKKNLKADSMMQLAPTDALMMLHDVLERDHRGFSFDYSSMQRNCWDVLTCVELEVHEKLQEFRQWSYSTMRVPPTEEDKIFFLVLDIFNIASDHEAHWELQRVARAVRGPAPPEETITKIGKEIDQWIRKRFWLRLTSGEIADVD
jgi:hypothetical protein